MDCIVYFEGTVSYSGRRIYIYIPTEYQEKLKPLHGKRLRLIAILENEKICEHIQEYEA